MKKVSKFVLMLLTFAMIFSLLSCSNGDVSSPEPGAEQQESSAEQPEQPAEKPDDSQGEEVVAGEEPLNPTNFNEEISVPLLPVDTHGVKADKVYKIGFANASVSNSWRVVMRDMLMDAANQIGVKIIETDANDNAEKQNEDIETLIAQDVDGFLIAAGFEDAVNPGIEAAYATGKPVIIFDRFVSTQDYTASVFYSDITCGEIAAEILVDALKEKKGSTEGAKVIVLEALAGAGTTSQRNEGIMNIFEPAGIEIVASYACNFSKDEAKKNMEDALVRFDPGEIDGIISHNGEQTLGAWEAIVEAGREDEFRGLISNIDGCNGVARLIKEGIVAGLSQFPCRCSVDALELLVKMLNDPNMEVEKEVFLTPDKVTQDNIDEWYLPEVPDNGWTA